MSHDPRDDYDDQPDRGPLAPTWLAERPAEVMLILGFLQVVITQLVMLSAIQEYRREVDEDLKECAFTTTQFLIASVAWLIGTAMSLIVIIGGLRFGECRRYPLCVFASVLCLFSLPCLALAPLGVPLGLWSLIVLARRDVRARFEANSR